jgi:hypothetical protein
VTANDWSRAKTARLHQQCFGLGVRFRSGRREHDARDAPAGIAELRHHALQIVESAAHGNAADRLALIRDRGRQNPAGQIFFTAPLSIARSSTSASAARPRMRIGADSEMRACWRVRE